jgi:hypothetical protein
MYGMPSTVHRSHDTDLGLRTRAQRCVWHQFGSNKHILSVLSSCWSVKKTHVIMPDRLSLLEGPHTFHNSKCRLTGDTQNPGWGTPEETIRKVEEFYATDYLDKALPIPGALEALTKLKELGYRAVIVTARQRRELHRSVRWIEEHYPGIFDDIICTGQSQETLADPNQYLTKLSKADVSNLRIFVERRC